MKKRFLLVNLEDCPENMHFQQAALRAASKLGAVLDVASGFEYRYDFMSPEKNRCGVTAPVFSPAQASALTEGKDYEAAIFLDLPLRANRAETYISLLLKTAAKRKLFVANHLAPLRGQSRATEVMARKGLFRFFDRVSVFSFDSEILWTDFGVQSSSIVRREYCLDCTYYSPGRKAPAGGYIFAAGTAGRSFYELLGALSLVPDNVRLKVATNASLSIPEKLAERVDVMDFNSNIHRIKELVFNADLSVAPVRDGHINPTAGMPTMFMAMALKRPVLCRGTEWMAKYIEHGRTGFLYKTLSVKSLADGIRRVLAMPGEEQAALGERARKVVLSKVNLDVFLLEYLRPLL